MPSWWKVEGFVCWNTSFGELPGVDERVKFYDKALADL